MDAGRRYRSRSGSPHAFVLDDGSVSLTSAPWQHERVMRTHCLHATFMMLQDRFRCDVGSARVSGGRSATLGGRSAISGFGPSRGKSCVAVLHIFHFANQTDTPQFPAGSPGGAGTHTLDTRYPDTYMYIVLSNV